MKKANLFLILLLLIVSTNALALDWPVWPDSTHHPVSAIYGVMQGNDYLHSGIDIAVPSGTPVYAMESGYVKAILTLYDGYSSWRIAIADSAGTGLTEGWMYAHITSGSIAFEVGDYVEAGDSIGVVVSWPGSPQTQEHLHLSRIRYGGDSAMWIDHFFDGWNFIDNPFDYLDNIASINDTTAPVISPAWNGDQMFAIAYNNIGSYKDIAYPISGDVDIICFAYDYHDYYNWRDSPYKMEYRLDGPTSTDWITSFILDQELGTYEGGGVTMTSLWRVIYQDDNQCNSGYISADSQAYFYNLTNTDNDGIIEPTDRDQCWHTADFNNGEYTIYARATDYFGQEAVESMTLTVANYFNLTGTVTLNGMSADPTGVLVDITPDNQSTTADEYGAFAVDSVGGGLQHLTISMPGYTVFDTTVMMNQNLDIDITLELAEFICGDVNFDSTINILDITYLIGAIYQGGNDPMPFESGDPNGDNAMNILDITYLISFLYQDGPPPGACYGTTI